MNSKTLASFKQSDKKLRRDDRVYVNVDKKQPYADMDSYFDKLSPFEKINGFCGADLYSNLSMLFSRDRRIFVTKSRFEWVGNIKFVINRSKEAFKDFSSSAKRDYTFSEYKQYDENMNKYYNDDLEINEIGYSHHILM